MLRYFVEYYIVVYHIYSLNNYFALYNIKLYSGVAIIFMFLVLTYINLCYVTLY